MGCTTNTNKQTHTRVETTMSTATKELATRELASEANAYFTRIHLDVNTKPSAPEKAPLSLAYPCRITFLNILFYTYIRVEVDIDGRKYLFEGHATGLGAGTVSLDGILYCKNEELLLRAKEFTFVCLPDQGGILHITWSKDVNATAVGVGGAVGSGGGLGEWKRKVGRMATCEKKNISFASFFINIYFVQTYLDDNLEHFFFLSLFTLPSLSVPDRCGTSNSNIWSAIAKMPNSWKSSEDCCMPGSCVKHSAARNSSLMEITSTLCTIVWVTLIHLWSIQWTRR